MGRVSITASMINQINELYYKCHVKSQVARELGISASTVAKYIQEGYTPQSEIQHKKVDLQEYRKRIENFILPKEEIMNPQLLTITEDEKTEMTEFWKELSI